VILKVDKAAKGPQVIVSRADASLVTRLFEMEVPEIYDSTVVIKACAREAGERTKIAVLSRDRDVDCVGACVGLKGMRVESIRRELRGEKIDIVEHSEDPVVFATHALSPAKISRVTVLEAATKHLEVIVDDTQLSLAIGKKGQNVRLAAKLMGWKIDIKSEEEKRQEVEQQMSALVDTGTPLSELKGLSESVREKLTAAGVTSIEKLGEMTGDDLENIPGVGPKMVEKISAAVQNYWEGGGESAVAADAETPSEASETTEAKAEVSAPESGAVRPDVGLDGAETVAATEPVAESAEPPVSSPDALHVESVPQPEAPESGPAESEQAGPPSAEAEAAKEN
jgi:N utilization substance protein A